MDKQSWIIGIIAVLLIGIVIVGVVGLSCIGLYNGLVSKDVSIKKMNSELNSQYQRRADLIPNLVSTVQASAQFEKSTQTEIAGLRSRAITGRENMKSAQTPEEIQSANGELSSVLSRLMVVVEAYPTLQSNQNFRDLSSQLEGTENRITYARTEYNDAVQDYETSVRSFPTSLFAGMFGFGPDKWKMFEADKGAKVVPVVKFDI
jgi:LemA protein